MASTLELFFDLVFVVAVSIASMRLHHALTEGHVGRGILDYAIVFFGIWWAWMNFTWFATSFDTDDWLYRLLTSVQMGGVLVFASGIPEVFEHHGFTALIIAYVVMRLAMVAQLLTFGMGKPLVQPLWVTVRYNWQRVDRWAPTSRASRPACGVAPAGPGVWLSLLDFEGVEACVDGWFPFLVVGGQADPRDESHRYRYQQQGVHQARCSGE